MVAINTFKTELIKFHLRLDPNGVRISNNQSRSQSCQGQWLVDWSGTGGRADLKPCMAREMTGPDCVGHLKLGPNKF